MCGRESSSARAWVPACSSAEDMWAAVTPRLWTKLGSAHSPVCGSSLEKSVCSGSLSACLPASQEGHRCSQAESLRKEGRLPGREEACPMAQGLADSGLSLSQGPRLADPRLRLPPGVLPHPVHRGGGRGHCRDVCHSGKQRGGGCPVSPLAGRGGGIWLADVCVLSWSAPLRASIVELGVCRGWPGLPWGSSAGKRPSGGGRQGRGPKVASAPLHAAPTWRGGCSTGCADSPGDGDQPSSTPGGSRPSDPMGDRLLGQMALGAWPLRFCGAGEKQDSQAPCCGLWGGGLCLRRLVCPMRWEAGAQDPPAAGCHRSPSGGPPNPALLLPQWPPSRRAKQPSPGSSATGSERQALLIVTGGGGAGLPCVCPASFESHSPSWLLLFF